MSLAIKFGDNSDRNSVSGFIYFDAVTKFNRNIGGTLTSHPLDAGVDISDHFVSENLKISIDGVISHADVSMVQKSILLDGERPLNYQEEAGPVTFKDSPGMFQKVLSGDFANLLTETPPTATFGENARRQNKNKQVENILQKLLSGVVFDQETGRLRHEMSLTTLYSFDKAGVFSLEERDLVVTSMAVEETAETGDGLYLSLTLEKPKFVTLEKAELPKDVSGALEKSSQPTSKKSKADSAEKKVGDKIEKALGEAGPKMGEQLKDTAREATMKGLAEGNSRLTSALAGLGVPAGGF